MAYRKCPNHGWIDTKKYLPGPKGELRCLECQEIVIGFREYHEGEKSE